MPIDPALLTQQIDHLWSDLAEQSEGDREGLAASTRLIRQRPHSPFWLRLVRVREGSNHLSACAYATQQNRGRTLN